MFLDMTINRNSELIEAAVKFHREGKIYPNTYVLDVDAIRENARKLAETAFKYDMKLYMMTKQIGRNPEIAKIIEEAGIEKAVAVDPWEAISLAKAGIKLGNVGHLVQIPKNMIGEILSFKPEVVTVFTVEKAKQVSIEAEKLGMRQDILLKVVGPKDSIYEGQAGGFSEENLVEIARKIKKLKGVNIIGVTTFPCLLYDAEKNEAVETENAKTLMRCAEKLRKELNIDIKQINAPSVTAVSTIPLLKELGANYGEPGHSITGTTPLHSSKVLDEIPAMVYVTEVSHLVGDKIYVYGGGYYRRANIKRAMVGKNFKEMKNNLLEAEEIPPEFIDYYGVLKRGDKKVEVGDTVIYAFRTQIFVTRSQVALVKGIHSGSPEIVGIYDNLGKKLR